MRRDLDALQTREFDLVVIGGGITGACVAHDAALRGLSVALLERQDFGGATSAASSKLLHGGIRYLQHGQLGRLRESARERLRFQRIAPHLTRYVPFLIPTYGGLTRGRWALRGAVALYELLCADAHREIADPSRRPPSARGCHRSEALRLAPVLEGRRDLTGAQIVYELHMHSSERMTLAFIKTAAASGTVVANYVAVEELRSEGRMVRGVRARDVMSGRVVEIRGRLVINATGPWIPALNRIFGLPHLRRDVTHFAKGTHIVTRPLADEVALVLPTNRRLDALIARGGRHVFVIPWRHHSLIGTTNTPFGPEPGGVRPTLDDARLLVADVNAALPGARLVEGDVRHAFAGLYPLTAGTIRPDVYQATGEYQVVDHGRLGHLDGIITVLGARYTTARRLAEQAVDLAVARLGLDRRRCRTATTALVGGDVENGESARVGLQRQLGPNVSYETIEHLLAQYGSETKAVLAGAAPGVEPLARLSPDRECVEAEVLFAVRDEMALQLDDVVFRRTGLGTIGHPGTACLTRCAAIMAQELGWSRLYTDEQVRRTAAMFTVE